MITKTSLQHPMLRVRLNNAMRAATKSSNRTGGIGFASVSGISIVHFRDRWDAFQFFDSRDRNITHTVLSALRNTRL